MRNITINEIAKLVGVSKGTVSKVLNDYPGISEKTRDRVRKTVKEMGFEPNSAAHALASCRTGTIGLVIPHSPDHSLSGAYWSSMVTAVTEAAIRNGDNLVLLLPRREGGLDELFTTIVRKRQMDGLIIGAELLDTRQLGTFMYHEMPFVTIGRNPGFAHYHVDIDNEAAAYDITRYMISRGGSRIALVTGPSDYASSPAREAGYGRALAQAGLGYSRCLNLPYDDPGTMLARITELMGRDSPDSVLCGAGGDFMFDCLNVLSRLGYTVPALKFATFDDYRFLDFTYPLITAVRQPIKAIGAAAVDMLSALIGGRTPESESAILKADIVARKSCGE
jgi:LacI family transcriptional regulator